MDIIHLVGALIGEAIITAAAISTAIIGIAHYSIGKMIADIGATRQPIRFLAKIYGG